MKSPIQPVITRRWLTKVVALSSLWAAFVAVPVSALDQGDIILRLGGAWVAPNDDSDDLELNGAPIPNSEVGVNNEWTLGFTVGYMVTDHFAVELLGVLPSEHDLDSEGSISGLGQIGEAKVFPPTLSLQYHFMPKSIVRPYVGVGVNYTHFFDENTSSSFDSNLVSTLSLRPTDIELDDSWGVAGHAGFDVTIKDNWFFNAAAWYIDMDTEATIKTASGSTLKTDVDLNPWVVMLGIGTTF